MPAMTIAIPMADLSREITAEPEGLAWGRQGKPLQEQAGPADLTLFGVLLNRAGQSAAGPGREAALAETEPAETEPAETEPAETEPAGEAGPAFALPPLFYPGPDPAGTLDPPTTAAGPGPAACQSSPPLPAAPSPAEETAAPAGEGASPAAIAGEPAVPDGFPGAARPRAGADQAVGAPAGEPLAAPGPPAAAAFAQEDAGAAGQIPAPLLERLKTGAGAAFSGNSPADSQARGGAGDSRAVDAPEPAGAEPGQAAPLAYGEAWAQATGAAEKTAAVERAVNRIIGDLSSITADRSQIRIVLEPEELGTLTITVSQGPGGVSARIRTDNQEIGAMMNDRLANLVQSLETNGVAVEQLDVLLGQAGQPLDFAHSGQGRREQQPPFSTLAARVMAGDEEVPAWPLFWGLGREGPAGPEDSDATVEYRV